MVFRNLGTKNCQKLLVWHLWRAKIAILDNFLRTIFNICSKLGLQISPNYVFPSWNGLYYFLKFEHVQMVSTVRNSVMRFEKCSVRKMYQRVFEVLLHSVEIQEIFLTLRFYVKSILAISKRVWNLNFEFETQELSKHSVEITDNFCHSDFTWNQFWRI